MQHFRNGFTNAVCKRNTSFFLLDHLLLQGSLCSIGYACSVPHNVQERSGTGTNVEPQQITSGLCS